MITPFLPFITIDLAFGLTKQVNGEGEDNESVLFGELHDPLMKTEPIGIILPDKGPELFHQGVRRFQAGGGKSFRVDMLINSGLISELE